MDQENFGITIIQPTRLCGVGPLHNTKDITLVLPQRSYKSLFSFLTGPSQCCPEAGSLALASSQLTTPYQRVSYKKIVNPHIKAILYLPASYILKTCQRQIYIIRALFTPSEIKKLKLSSYSSYTPHGYTSNLSTSFNFVLFIHNQLHSSPAYVQ